MKKLLILTMIVGGSLVANSVAAQVKVDVNFEKQYPGATYYEYPKWRGHDHDKAYYEHYHARFEREHKEYYRGRDFDHDRYERENHWKERHH